MYKGSEEEYSPPKYISLVPRFHQCLKVLVRIFEANLPTIVMLISSIFLVVMYGFVDASGSGFGSTLLVKGQVQYRVGTWSSEEDVNSLNWREYGL